MTRRPVPSGSLIISMLANMIEQQRVVNPAAGSSMSAGLVLTCQPHMHWHPLLQHHVSLLMTAHISSCPVQLGASDCSRHSCSLHCGH